MARRRPGDGTVYEWRGQWRAQYTPPGGKRQTIYGATEREVTRQLRLALGAVVRGETVGTDGRVTLADWTQDWMAAKAATVEPSSLASYRVRAARIVSVLGGIRLSRLTAGDVERLDAASLAGGLAPRTVRETHSLLGQMLQTAMERGIVAHNVARLAKPPRVPRGAPAALDERQVGRLLAVARDDPLEALWVLAVTTGMRQGELMALRWQDVDLVAGHVTITHGMQRPRRLAHPKSLAGRRRIALPAAARAALARRRETVASAADSSYVFGGRRGGLLWQSTIHRQWHRLADRAQLPPTKFHELRHTAATLMLRAGESPRVVAEILGHADASLVMRLYGHVLPSMRVDAVSRMDALIATLPQPER